MSLSQEPNLVGGCQALVLDDLLGGAIPNSGGDWMTEEGLEKEGPRTSAFSGTCTDASCSDSCRCCCRCYCCCCSPCFSVGTLSLPLASLAFLEFLLQPSLDYHLLL